jgi:hypothetical protein
VVSRAIDQRHLDLDPTQRFRSEQPTEAAADDHDVMTGRHG